jgi:hypothetical protein
LRIIDINEQKVNNDLANHHCALYQEQEMRLREVENRISARDYEYFTGGERFLVKMQTAMGRRADPVLEAANREGRPKTERKKAKRGR